MDYTPQEPGIYWARSRKEMKRYDCVVHVGGESPFLKIEKILPRGISSPDSVWLEWGPKIEEPEVPKELIKK